ncbi:MAG TPA: hypothetical protein VMX17_15730 [Candidatus Glassbacteria bacterium]|nr:hypothetical protein [Candidatus Glassbacteria bacterium]
MNDNVKKIVKIKVRNATADFQWFQEQIKQLIERAEKAETERSDLYSILEQRDTQLEKAEARVAELEVELPTEIEHARVLSAVIEELETESLERWDAIKELKDEEACKHMCSAESAEARVEELEGKYETCRTCGCTMEPWEPDVRCETCPLPEES